MALERCVSLVHTTFMRWLHDYAPKLGKRVKPKLKNSQYFQSFNTACETISVYKTMHMILNGKVKRVASIDAIAQVNFVNELFGVAA